MNSKILLGTLFFLLSFSFAHSQQWTGSSTTSGSISRTGNVGIGTTSPTSPLSVKGRGRFGHGPAFLDWTYEPSWGGSSNKWAGYLGFNAYRDNEDQKDFYRGENRYTSKGVIEGSNYGFRFLYRNHNNYDSDGQHQLTELMRITNNGNVGIGTDNPNSFKLAVEGKIGAREIQVTSASPWPDFVFLKSYCLRPLGEVEAFINENGHLPEMPSAEDVKENGINLGEMDAKLLQKIEELTLYMIEQNEKTETVYEKVLELENENLLLKNQIKDLKP